MILNIVLSVVTVSFFLYSDPLYAQKEFPEWSEGVYAEVKRRIDERQGGNRGALASARLRSVWQLISVHLDDPIETKLEIVNEEMNKLPWIADSDLWKQPDYWATPFETITTFGGDCEDIAIAKYAVLRLMRVPSKHMGFAHVVTSNGEHHMVLVYKGSEKEDAMILDNQIPHVKRAKDRPDLIGVYIFQDLDKEAGGVKLAIIKDEGDGQRSLKSVKENPRLKKWVTVKERSIKNTDSYIPFNDGKPLVPELR